MTEPTTGKTFFLHTKTITDPKTQARYTVAGVVYDGHMLFGVARCSNKDLFTKERGRKVAEGRALRKPCFHKVLPADGNLGTFFVENALEHLSKENFKCVVKTKK